MTQLGLGIISKHLLLVPVRYHSFATDTKTILFFGYLSLGNMSMLKHFFSFNKIRQTAQCIRANKKPSS